MNSWITIYNSIYSKNIFQLLLNCGSENICVLLLEFHMSYDKVTRLCDDSGKLYHLPKEYENTFEHCYNTFFGSKGLISCRDNFIFKSRNRIKPRNAAASGLLDLQQRLPHSLYSLINLALTMNSRNEPRLIPARWKMNTSF